MRWYYDYFFRNLGSRDMLGVFKSTADQPESEITVWHMLNQIVIAGSPSTVLDHLIQIVDEIGVFGGLLAIKTDRDNPTLHKRSYQLLAESVMPRLRQHVSGL